MHRPRFLLQYTTAEAPKGGPCFLQAYETAQRLQSANSLRDPFKGQSGTLFAPPFEQEWNEAPTEVYKTRYGQLETPKVISPRLEALYISLLDEHRSIYEEFISSGVSAHKTRNHFYAFLNDVARKCSFETRETQSYEPVVSVWSLTKSKRDGVCAAQRAFVKMHRIKCPYNIWENMRRQKAPLFHPSEGVDAMRRLVVSTPCDMPKSLLFFLLQRYQAVIDSSTFIAEIRRQTNFAAIERNFHSRCIQDIIASSWNSWPSLRFIIERITDTHEAHYYFLVDLCCERASKLPAYCHFRADKLYEELSDSDKRRVVCSHATFRNFYLKALPKLIAVRAVQCFDEAVRECGVEQSIDAVRRCHDASFE